MGVLRHFNLTLTGAVQRLSDVYGANLSLAELQKQDVPLRTVQLQPDGANGNPIFVGGSSPVSSSNYGFRLEAATATIPPAPYVLGEHDEGPHKLSNWFVIGTANQVLHIFVHHY